MVNASTHLLILLVTVILLAGCSERPNPSAEAPATSLLSPTIDAQSPHPTGPSYKNCRGGKNGHWWIAHSRQVTAADLDALSGFNLTNADRAAFDPADVATLTAWLKDGLRTDDIFYALSAQLAVAVLNVRHELLHESRTAVLVDQSNRELARERPSIGFMETLLQEFRRCQ